MDRNSGTIDSAERNGHQATNSSAPARSSDWQAKADELAERLARQQLADLGRALGLPLWAIDCHGIGYATAGPHRDDENNLVQPCWTFPECDGERRIIGINCRYPNGAKKAWPGGKRGLFIPRDWDLGEGPLLLPEGASGTLAAFALGLPAIGRPNNRLGVEHLIQMLQETWPDDREILVVADFDLKGDGSWPGKEGAIETATKLQIELGRPLRWVLPPDRQKDLRDWAIAQHPDSSPEAWRALRAKLLEQWEGERNQIVGACARRGDAGESPGTNGQAKNPPRHEPRPEIFTARRAAGDGTARTAMGSPRDRSAGSKSSGRQAEAGEILAALNLALAVATGGVALGSIDVEPGEVLYLALEDTKRRLKDRIAKLAARQELGEWPATLRFARGWAREDKGGLCDLLEWLINHANARLIVIDTWPKFRPAPRKGDAYEEDYAHAADLKDLADKRHVGILALAHCRKLGAVDPLTRCPVRLA